MPSVKARPNSTKLFEHIQQLVLRLRHEQNISIEAGLSETPPKLTHNVVLGW
jgi:hypothetical protein